MYPLWMAAFLAALLALTGMVWEPMGRSDLRSTGSADAVASALGMYHAAAEIWAAQTPGTTGDVPSHALALPLTWRSMGGIRSYRSGAYLATWYGGSAYPATAVSLALSKRTGYELGVGVATGGWVAAPRGTVMPVPSVVPEGAAVKVTKLY